MVLDYSDILRIVEGINESMRGDGEKPRAYSDLDIGRFVSTYSAPGISGEIDYPENFVSNQLLNLKTGEELEEQREVINNLYGNQEAKKYIWEVLEGERKLESELNRKEESPSPSANYDYEILKFYRNLVETGKEIDSGVSLLDDFSRFCKERSEGEYFEVIDELIEQMESFGRMEIAVSYDHKGALRDVATISDEKGLSSKLREKIGELMNKNKVGQAVSFNDWDRRKFVGDSLEFLFQNKKDGIDSFLRWGKEFRYLLGGLNYIESLKESDMLLTWPEFDKEEGFEFKNLYYPLLPIQEGSSNREFQQKFFSAENPPTTEGIVPNDVSVDDQMISILTGPNSSGKTVYVKSIGLAYSLAQNGFSVPAEDAHLSKLKSIYTHFVHPGDIEKGEGMFSNELRRAMDLFKKASEESLLIIDEPIRGSSEKDAEEITYRFMRGLKKLSSPTFITTHVHPVAETYENDNEVRNLKTGIEIVEGNINPTYNIKEGRAEKSYGVEIADQMDFTEEEIINLINGEEN